MTKKKYSLLKNKYFWFVFFIVVIVLQSQIFIIKPKLTISKSIEKKLNQLGEKAIVNYDVPVAAIITYKDSIIGDGFNTVKRDKRLSAHAEIEAINKAYKSYGEDFFKLNRDSLKLYSTYQPCEMCQGALIHYNIQNVFFEKEKSLSHSVKLSLKKLNYNLHLRRFDAKGLQERLFLMHPNYKKN